MFRSKYAFWVCLFCVVGFACRKVDNTIVPYRVATTTHLDLRSIVFCSPDTGYIFGGTRFDEGVRLATFDGGKTWQTYTMGKKAVYAAAFTTPQIGAAIGQDGWLYGSSNGGETWQIRGNPNWKLMQGIAAQADGRLIAVGGVSYRIGNRVAYDSFGNVLAADTTMHELTDVAFSAPNVATAVGYGAVYRTLDGGITWVQQDVSGDFFKAIQFVTQKVGYIVGFAGSVWKTADGGETWQCLREGNSIGADGELTDVFFTDAQHGYVCGTHGLLWATDDGAKTWREIHNLPDITFNAVYFADGKGWLAGNKGVLIQF